VTPALKAQLAQSFQALPLSFEANAGQAGTGVKFLSRGQHYELLLTERDAILAVRKGDCAEQTRPDVRSGEAVCPHDSGVVRMRLAGASQRAAGPIGEELLAGTANYFVGSDQTKWRTGVPTYAKVRYQAIYSGVDLVYYGNQRQLEYDFVVAPGADPKHIRLQFDGAKQLGLSDSGDLVVTTAGGAIAFRKPDVYQIENGRRKPVPGSFTLVARNTVGFRLGGYDRAAPLVIDPILVYSTYLGGTAAYPLGDTGGVTDSANGIAVDAAGNVYIAGSVDSLDLPLTQGAFQTTNKSPRVPPAFGYTAFVAKLNSAGSALLYSTYLGGTVEDDAYAVAVDGSGNAYVAGKTFSGDFPVTEGAFQTTDPGTPGQDNLVFSPGFVSKLNPTGSALIYSTYLGGEGGAFGQGEQPGAISVDGAGNAYIAGLTYSARFPVTPGAFQSSNTCFTCSIAFVTKLNPAGSALVYSTYLGGSGAEQFSFGPPVFTGDGATALAVDRAGNAYIGGFAHSGNFPVTAGVFQARNKAYQSSGLASQNPGLNAFVSKLNPDGTALVYSTYLGGSGHDGANALAVDGAGNAYVAGGASSTDFPVTMEAFQAANRSGSTYNAFVTRLNPSGSTLTYSTYLGGSGSDSAHGLAVDGSGNVYVAGGTTSPDFPVTPGAFQTTNPSAGGTAFVTALNPAGSALIYSTYLGGSGSESASGLALDGSGNVYIAGESSSPDFPVTPGAIQTANRSAGKGTNAFVAKLDPGAILGAPSIEPGTINPVFSITSTIQAGELVSIKGANLATSTAIRNANYPTSFGGTSVTIDGKAAYLLYVSPTQINLQAPDDSATGPVPVVVTTPSGSATSTVNLAPFAPSFLLLDTTHVAGIILRPDGGGSYGTYDILGPTGNSLGYPTVAAKAGDIVALFVVGLGPTNRVVPAGEAFIGAAPATNTVNVLIGNASVTPLFAGLASQGLGQINLIVPAGLGAGDVSLVVTVGGAQSQAGVVISLR
jgi:uncharacterized protein (TIGR03437 family)